MIQPVLVLLSGLAAIVVGWRIATSVDRMILARQRSVIQNGRYFTE